MKPPGSDLFAWAAHSKARLAAVTLVWVGSHAVFAVGAFSGKFEFFSAEREPVGYWADVIVSGLGLLAVDFAIARHFLGVRREKPNQTPEPTRKAGGSS